MKNGLVELYRLVFSLVVVSHHAKYIAGAPADQTLVPFGGGGYPSVEFFFILSGFLMMKKACRTSLESSIGEVTWNEIFKKIKAVYPAAIIAYVIGLCIRTYVTHDSIPWQILHSFPDLLMLNGVGFYKQQFSFLGSLWYVSSLIMAILLLFPWMVRFKDGFCQLAAPVIAILGYGQLSMVVGSVGTLNERFGPICGGTLRALSGFSLGCVVYYLVEKRRSQVEETRISSVERAAGCIVGFTAFATVLILMIRRDNDYVDFIKMMLFAVMLYTAFLYGDFKSLHNRVIYALGRYSVTIFVVHVSLLQCSKEFWGETWTEEYIKWMVLTNVISIIVHIITHTGIFTRIWCRISGKTTDKVRT